MASPCAGTITVRRHANPISSGDSGPLFEEFTFGPQFPYVVLVATITEDGYFPSLKPTWSIQQKPSGSTVALSNIDSGIGHDTTVNNLDKIGKYVINAACGTSNSDAIDIYVARLQGPPKLVSTLDSPGKWVQYQVVGLSGGTYSWQVIAQDACIEIEAPANGASVNVRAKANKFSGSAGDQTLQCTFTLSGKQMVLSLPITVVKPSFAFPTNKGTTVIQAGWLSRVLTYQIKDQFGEDLKETSTYTNHLGQAVTVKVVDLLVSEQLLVVSKDPSSASDPTAAINIAVSDNGTFNDTHMHPRNTEIQVNQIIQIHIDSWVVNNQGFGNPIRYLIIKSGFSPDVDKIRIYENNNGVPGGEIPEEQ